jgi:hypothetical protein
MDYHDPGNKVLYSIKDNDFSATVYKDGAPILTSTRQLWKHKGDYDLVFDITDRQISVSEGGAKLDILNRPSAGAQFGKIGFKGEIEVQVKVRP